MLGVEGRVARHGDDLAGAHVEHDGRTGVGRRGVVDVGRVDAVHDRVLGGALDLRVDTGHERVARRGARPPATMRLGRPATSTSTSCTPSTPRSQRS